MAAGWRRYKLTDRGGRYIATAVGPIRFTSDVGALSLRGNGSLAGSGSHLRRLGWVPYPNSDPATAKMLNRAMVAGASCLALALGDWVTTPQHIVGLHGTVYGAGIVGHLNSWSNNLIPRNPT